MKTNHCKLKHSPLRMALIIVGSLAAAMCSNALTVLSGPFFTPATNAPLAGVLTLTTDTDSQVSVSVTDGTGTWERDFFDYGTNHALTLLGFMADQTNEITVTVRDQYRNECTVPEPLTFVTGPLPAAMPALTLITNNPDQMEPGYTLFRISDSTTGASYVTIVDNSARVVWYSTALPTSADVHQLSNGNLFYSENTATNFAEANMLGEMVTNWSTPLYYPTDGHEDLLTDHGTILYISYGTTNVSNFPSSDTDSNAPTGSTDVEFDRVVEISATNSILLNTWSLIDILDPTRVNYLCYALTAVFGVDPEHANAVVDVTSDDSLIVSLRNQDAIVKFSRSGQLKWILGPHENWGAEWQPYLLTPVGTPFEWNYAQHAPFITPQGTLLCYDDGNCRAEPFGPPVPDQGNYSRAAEFSIDETNMQVSQVWEFTGTNYDRLYTGALGNARMLPQTGNVLMTFGYVTYENGEHADPIATNATIVHLKEVTHAANPSVVFDLEVSDPGNTNASSLGYTVYRCYRIPDLYSHQAVPVANLTVQIESGAPTLQFTADPTRTYEVQVSSDLVNWNDIGSASQDDASGNFSFQDLADASATASFYRVITQ
jgi:arylsulfate sulfotransferase